MTALKYALLILPRRSTDDSRELILGDGIESFVGRLPALVHPTQLEHWKRWIGELRWRDIEADARCVVVTDLAKVPGVLDLENEALKTKLRPVVAAMHLTRGLRRPWGTVFMFSGDATGPRALRDARSFEEFPERQRPFYERREEYMRSFDWAQDPWLDEWVAAYALVGQGPWLPLVSYALNSMGHASAEDQLEFRIPELVRCAETILGLGRGQGGPEFAERALAITPGLTTAPFMAGVDVAATLREVYTIRNSCVHGKLPFEELAARGDTGELRVAQLEFAAEEVARAALDLALRRPGPHFDSRDALELAWDQGRFP